MAQCDSGLKASVAICGLITGDGRLSIPDRLAYNPLVSDPRTARLKGSQFEHPMSSTRSPRLGVHNAQLLQKPELVVVGVVGDDLAASGP